MQKRVYLSIVLLLYLLPAIAQTDSARRIHIVKKRASAYDTNAVYFNKWKVNLYVDIGFMDISPFITGYPHTPGIFGILNPSYIESALPSLNFSGTYGLTEKSAIGFTMNFQQTSFSPVIPSSTLSSGNVEIFQLQARYLHCLRSWRHFYYGFQYGVLIFQNNYNPNTFVYAPPYITFFSSNTVGFFAGARILVVKHFWLHYEVQEDVPIIAAASFPLVNEQFGINYCIDTHKSHKPVKPDPFLLKRQYKTIRDSLREKHKYEKQDN